MYNWRRHAKKHREKLLLHEQTVECTKNANQYYYISYTVHRRGRTWTINTHNLLLLFSSVAKIYVVSTFQVRPCPLWSPLTQGSQGKRVTFPENHTPETNFCFFRFFLCFPLFFTFLYTVRLPCSHTHMIFIYIYGKWPQLFAQRKITSHSGIQWKSWANLLKSVQKQSLFPFICGLSRFLSLFTGNYNFSSALAPKKTIDEKGERKFIGVVFGLSRFPHLMSLQQSKLIT